MTPEEIYRKAIERYGYESQVHMAIEEMAELMNALMKFKRCRVDVPAIIEEIADVKIMCEQLALIYGKEAVQTQVEYKSNRLKDRLGL